MCNQMQYADYRQTFLEHLVFACNSSDHGEPRSVKIDCKAGLAAKYANCRRNSSR